MSSKSGTVTPYLTRTLAPGSNRGDVVGLLGLVMGSLNPGPRSVGADRLEADRDLAHPGQGVPPIPWPDHSKTHGPSVARVAEPRPEPVYGATSCAGDGWPWAGVPVRGWRTPGRRCASNLRRPSGSDAWCARGPPPGRIGGKAMGSSEGRAERIEALRGLLERLCAPD